MRVLTGLAIIVLLFFSPFHSTGQDWVAMMRDSRTNVHDVEKAFYQWYNARQHSKKEDKDEKQESVEDENYEAFQRWDWYMKNRTSSNGTRPSQAVIATQYQQYLTSQSTARALSGSGNWTYVGNNSVPNNGGGAGRVNRIRFYPGNTNIIYACTPSGGLWKSVNGGSSWATNTDKLLDLAVSDIAIDPVNTNVMYIATGDNDGISSGYTPAAIGVLKSTDGGNTWNATSLYYTMQNSGPNEYTVNELLIDPDNHNVIFAATSNALYRSPDAGVSWAPVIYGDIKDMAFEPYHSSVMYACTYSSQFYRSADSGRTFSRELTGLPTSGVGRMSLAVTPDDSNRVYVLVAQSATNNYGFYGLYLSTDRGQSFQQQSNSPNLLGWSPNGDDAGGQGWYTLSLAVSPTDANTVVVGGVNIWASSDGGSTWSLNGEWTGSGAPYVHADIHQLYFLPGSGSTYFAACDGGVFKTSNNGGNWNDISSNLAIAEEYSIGLSASNANMWLTGWQDNGTNLSGSPGSRVVGGDGMVCFIDYSNNNNMFASLYDGAFEMSGNGGVSWGNATSGITETGSWVTRWMQDPQSPNTLFAGFNNVWKSTNQGASWFQLSNFSFASPITAIAVAPSNDNYIYAVQSGALWVTANGGATWEMKGNYLPWAAGSIPCLAVDPNKPNRLWIVFSGYLQTCKVFQSNDTGNSWLNVSGNLPNIPVNCIAYQPGTNDGIYVGTDMGVYYHDTILNNWINYSNGLPNVIVYDLKIYSPGAVLRAATFGRGTWQTPLYSSPVSKPTAYFYAMPQKLCAGTTVQYTDTSANQPTNWNWTFSGGTPAASNQQNPTVTYSNAGKYWTKLTVSNINGGDSLVDSSYITVYPNPPAPSIIQSVNNDTLTCTTAGMVYYEWYISGNTVGGGYQNKFYPVWYTGQYEVFCMDTNGCTANTTKRIIVTGLNEISDEDGINVYPNPATGDLHIEFNLSAEKSCVLSLTNVLGQTVYNNKVDASAQKDVVLNVSDYTKGIYFLNVKGKNISLVKKIVIY